MSKNIVIAGLSLWIIYLLKNKNKPTGNLQEIDLRDGTWINIDGTGSRDHIAHLSSATPIKALYIEGTKGDGSLSVGIQGKVDMDYVPAWNQIKGIKNISVKNGMPTSF